MTRDEEWREGWFDRIDLGWVGLGLKWRWWCFWKGMWTMFVMINRRKLFAVWWFFLLLIFLSPSLIPPLRAWVDWRHKFYIFRLDYGSVFFRLQTLGWVGLDYHYARWMGIWWREVLADGRFICTCSILPVSTTSVSTLYEDMCMICMDVDVPFFSLLASHLSN